MAYRPIRNSAQLASSAIRFQRRPPAADLADTVSEFWQYDVCAPFDRVPNQVFPSGCTVLRFNIGRSHVEPIIYGPSLSATMKGWFTRGVSAFGAALRLERARTLVGCDVRALRDQRLGLGLIWRDGLDQVCEQLWHADGFSQRIAVLESYLRERSRTRLAPPADFLGVIAALEAHGASQSARAGMGISERTLRRHFDCHIGLSPKELERVLRLQRTLRALVEHSDPSCARIALAEGFSDQPHLIREFRRLLGMSPGQLLEYEGCAGRQSLECLRS